MPTIIISEEEKEGKASIWSCVQLVTLLKIEDAMFSFINTPEGITNLPIANTHFCRIFGSVDLRAFSPRPAPDRPADFHSRPAPRIFTLAPPRPAPQKNTPPRTSLV